MPVDVTMWAIPVFAAAIVLEITLHRRARAARQRGDGRAATGRALRGYRLADSRESLALGLIYSAVMIGWRLVEFAWLSLLWNWRITDLGTSWVTLVVAVFVLDFFYYWEHRLSHEVRLLWAIHVNHHSSEHYNLSTALRQPALPLLTVAFWSLLPLVGFRPSIVLIAWGINLLYQFWIHTELIDRLPRPIEWLFNTPSHHRVHHGSDVAYLDRNYGGILILWDRLLGTFTPEGAPVTYGLTKNLTSHRIDHVALHELIAIGADVRRARRWRDRFGYVFRGPGWAPSPSPAPAPARATAPR